MIEPKTLPGFMSLLPEDQILFDKMKEIIKKNYQKYGFLPLDTPVLESSEILLAKSGGETEKQIYEFKRGDNDLCMRFDLTVPLAKYVAENLNELNFPFARYEISKVYRGERPQKGRFREFYQCDIDVIGNETLGIVNDAELVSVINATFEALNIGDFTVMLNNRKLLGGFFASLGIGDPTDALRTVDKLDKIGKDNVRKELVSQGITEEAAEKIIALLLSKEQTLLDLCEASCLPEEMKQNFCALISERCSTLSGVYCT